MVGLSHLWQRGSRWGLFDAFAEKLARSPSQVVEFLPLQSLPLKMWSKTCHSTRDCGSEIDHPTGTTFHRISA